MVQKEQSGVKSPLTVIHTLQIHRAGGRRKRIYPDSGRPKVWCAADDKQLMEHLNYSSD